jgi:hypothetical protein
MVLVMSARATPRFESSGGGNTPRLWLISVEVSAVGEGDRSCPFPNFGWGIGEGL